MNNTTLLIGQGNMGSAVYQKNLAQWLASGRVLLKKNSQVSKDRYPGVEYFFDQAEEDVKKNIPQNLKANLIVVAFKPKNKDKLKDYIPHITQDTLIISLMAGVSPQAIISEIKNSSDQVVSVIPNMGVKVDKSFIGYCASGATSDENLRKVKQIFEKLGKTCALTWDEMINFTSFASSGWAIPPIIYAFMSSALEKHCQLTSQDARARILDAAINFRDVDLKALSDDSLTQARKMLILNDFEETEKGLPLKSIESMLSDSTEAFAQKYTADVRNLIKEQIRVIFAAMIEGGISLGFSKEISTEIVLSLISGTALLAQKTGEDFKKLADEVTSPDGTTRAYRGQIECNKGSLAHLFISGLKDAARVGMKIDNDLKLSAREFLDVLKNSKNHPEKIAAAKTELDAILAALNSSLV